MAVKNHDDGLRRALAQRRKTGKSRGSACIAAAWRVGWNSLQITPIGEKAAAVIVMSEEAMAAPPGFTRGRAVRVAASSTVSDQAFEGADAGVDLTERPAPRRRGAVGRRPSDSDMVEVRDALRHRGAAVRAAERWACARPVQVAGN